jgi:hypothetical protein
VTTRRYIPEDYNFKIEVFYQSPPPPLECATADGHFQVVQQELEERGLNWLSSSQCIGIGIDGATSLIGVENGFVQKVRKNLSHVISIHCIARRINLSVLSAVKNVKCIDDIDSILKQLYKFYQRQ